MNLFVMMECKKKIKNYRFGSLCRYRVPWSQHSVKLEKWALGKAKKIGAQKTIFSALPSAVTMALGKEI